MNAYCKREWLSVLAVGVLWINTAAESFLADSQFSELIYIEAHATAKLPSTSEAATNLCFEDQHKCDEVCEWLSAMMHFTGGGLLNLLNSNPAEQYTCHSHHVEKVECVCLVYNQDAGRRLRSFFFFLVFLSSKEIQHVQSDLIFVLQESLEVLLCCLLCLLLWILSGQLLNRDTQEWKLCNFK